MPQAVLAVARDNSSIFVQWDRLSCIERNSEITGYTVRYARSGGGSSDITILGTTRSNRTFTILGLSVSNYTVMVAADTGNMTRGPFSIAIPVRILGKYTYLHGLSSHFNTVKMMPTFGMYFEHAFTMQLHHISEGFICFQNVVFWSFVYVLLELCLDLPVLHL